MLAQVLGCCWSGFQREVEGDLFCTICEFDVAGDFKRDVIVVVRWKDAGSNKRW